MAEFYTGVEDSKILNTIKMSASLISFGTALERGSILKYSEVIISPVKFFKFYKTAKSGKQEDIAEALKYAFNDLEQSASELLAAFCLSIVYSKQFFRLQSLQQPEKFFTKFFLDTGCVIVDENGGGMFSLDRFELILKSLQNLPLMDKYHITDAAEEQIVYKENILKSYNDDDATINKLGVHPFVYKTIDKILSKDIEERFEIYGFMTKHLTDIKYLKPKFELEELEMNLSTNPYFTATYESVSANGRYEKCEEILLEGTNKAFRKFLPINGEILDTYLPEGYVFERNELFIKLINHYANNTLVKRTYWITPKDNILHVKICADNLFLFNDALFLGMEQFVLFLRMKFGGLDAVYTSAEAVIIVNDDEHNFNKIDFAIEHWSEMFKAHGFSHFSVYHGLFDESDNEHEKIVDIDFTKEL